MRPLYKPNPSKRVQSVRTDLGREQRKPLTGEWQTPVLVVDPDNPHFPLLKNAWTQPATAPKLRYRWRYDGTLEFEGRLVTTGTSGTVAFTVPGVTDPDPDVKKPDFRPDRKLTFVGHVQSAGGVVQEARYTVDDLTGDVTVVYPIGGATSTIYHTQFRAAVVVVSSALLNIDFDASPIFDNAPAGTFDVVSGDVRINTTGVYEVLVTYRHQGGAFPANTDMHLDMDLNGDGDWSSRQGATATEMGGTWCLQSQATGVDIIPTGQIAMHGIVSLAVVPRTYVLRASVTQDFGEPTNQQTATFNLTLTRFGEVT